MALNFERICITGGAGFVGSNLAVSFRRTDPDVDIIAVDSLKRRGSELTLPRLQEHDVRFFHGDIRSPEDLEGLPDFDLLLDCSAEPSVQAGTTGSPAYVLHTNLTGTIHCLEAARVRGAAVLFLSTSRVYPLDTLNAVPYDEDESRYVWDASTERKGLSSHGVAEDYPLDGVRSFYGASKLASEFVLHEYVYGYGMKALINRCGVIGGPWQMGKVDQGLAALWTARHAFRKPLTYNGFGGSGKQVRDLLHIDDLARLLRKQCETAHDWRGDVYNVGGGPAVSVSLRELTAICEDVTGNRIEIGSDPDTSPVDVRIYLSDARKAMAAFDWKPKRSARDIVEDVYAWIESDRDRLATVLG